MTRSSLKLQVLFLLKVNYKLTNLKKVSAYHELNNAGSGRGRCSGSGKNLFNYLNYKLTNLKKFPHIMNLTMLVVVVIVVMVVVVIVVMAVVVVAVVRIYLTKVTFDTNKTDNLVYGLQIYNSQI